MSTILLNHNIMLFDDRTVNEVVKCIKSFIRRCGTPLQRELFDFGTDYFLQTIKQFCDVGPLRESKLKIINKTLKLRKLALVEISYCIDAVLMDIQTAYSQDLAYESVNTRFEYQFMSPLCFNT